MKYFSLSYKPEKYDYQNYYRDFRKANLINQFKRTAFSIVFAVIITVLFFRSESIGFVIPIVFILFISFFMPLVYSKKISIDSLLSKYSQNENRYDFYADHIEIHYSDSEGRLKIEKHLEMRGFTAVAESSSNFYFSYKNDRMLIIPKRILDEEKYGMIKNLIKNYFSDIYMAIWF